MRRKEDAENGLDRQGDRSLTCAICGRKRNRTVKAATVWLGQQPK
jgi:hypothetical protein